MHAKSFHKYPHDSITVKLFLLQTFCSIPAGPLHSGNIYTNTHNQGCKSCYNVYILLLQPIKDCWVKHKWYSSIMDIKDKMMHKQFSDPHSNIILSLLVQCIINKTFCNLWLNSVIWLHTTFIKLVYIFYVLWMLAKVAMIVCIY